MNKTVISFIRQELQNSRKAMFKDSFSKLQNSRKAMFKESFSKLQASFAKIRNILLSFEYIRKENKHLNLNLICIIVKYVSIYIRSFKRSNYFIRFFFGKQTYLQSSVKQSKRDNSSQIIKKKL